MAIRETVEVDVATVEVNDDYRVELVQIRKVVDYSPQQAVALANELIQGARAAEAALAQRHKDDRARSEAAQPAVVNGEVVF